MSAPRRGRLVKALLRAHRSGLRREELERVPALRRIDSGGALLPCSLAEIRQAATAGAVTVLDPRQRADRHVVGERPVFVLDEAERSAIGDQLGCQFQPPPVRAPRRSVLGTLRRTSHVVGAGLTRAMSVAFHPFRRAPLPDAALTDAERTFVSAVREQLPLTRNPDALDAHLCRGAGPIRQARDAAAGLLLPRDNPRVRACIAAHARDRAWLYPGYLIATRGRSQPPPLLRARWLRWLVERGSD